MSLEALGGLLRSAPQYQQLKKSLSVRRASARAQVLREAVPFALATLWQDLGLPVLVVAPRPEDARRLYEQLTTWCGADAPVLHFPETETLPFERLVSDVGTVHQRIRTLAALSAPSPRGERGPEGEARPLVVASISAIAQKTIDRDAFVSSSHTLRRGQEVDLQDLLDLWRRMGYQLEPTVYTPGFASRRGGILDIFPVGMALPVRIELWGNEIDSIRRFDPSSQRSSDSLDSVTIFPAQETLPALTDRDHLDRMLGQIDVSNCTPQVQQRLAEEFNRLLDGYEVEDINFYAGFFNRSSLLDYFPEDGLLVLYRPAETAEAAFDTDARAAELRRAKEGRGELPRRFPSSYLTWSEVEAQAARIDRRLEVASWGANDLVDQDVAALPFASAPTYLGKLERFAEDVRALLEGGHRVVAVSSYSGRLCEVLEGHGLERGGRLSAPESLDAAPSPGTIAVLQTFGAGLSDGLVLEVEGRRLVVLSDSEIFGVAKQRRAVRRTTARQRNAFLAEIRAGDYVVHVEHGIARFLGTERLATDEGDKEYLVLQYADEDKLYVPMEQMDRVSPYIAPSDQPPSLTRLGTQEWKRTKERVARSTREMAAELLSLYAARELVQGHAYAPDTPWQVEMERAFPFEETPDQLTTIAEVKADMENPRPMDRLICGDVGYGKTEIALRAAFKAVMDGRQVAVLVPTTVLAQQHYATFSQRLSPYPVTIEVLSRFRTDKEQQDIIQRLAEGKVDICIGTHRLIQKDVRFKDLGLVIIDEEQRFGVAHKERLKQMRKEVDVLTLTATPIPRTLHMALAGVRDLSTIQTVPEGRLPIKTYLSEFSDELVREAILRELDRQGQVYFLHNRVHNIDYMAGYVRALVPEARVAVAHGQMPEHELEQTMLDFADGKYDVLVCTTIIESGLDIPNVNTLIVNRADTFGLAQLYQLRGRVGRSARRAYAYLLVPKARSITEAAEKRLRAMMEATELGAGFQIAMKDLEIRGAGNILGAEQSGHIHAVGFELYTRLLAEAVEQLRAQRAEQGLEQPAAEEAELAVEDITASLVPPAAPAIDLGIPAHIPQEYIQDLPTRLGVYHRLVRAATMEEVAALEDELRDRFGPLPWQAQNLLYVARLRLQAQRAGVEAINKEDGRIVLHLADDIGGARRSLQRILGAGVDIGNTQIRLSLDHHQAESWEKPLLDTLARLADFKEKVLASLAGEAASRQRSALSR